MKKKIDIEKIAYHMREIIIALGDNPDREGLKETPMRVAKMYEENFEGMLYNNDEITEMFGKTFEEEDYVNKNNSDFVVVKDIPDNSIAVGNPCKVIKKIKSGKAREYNIEEKHI